MRILTLLLLLSLSACSLVPAGTGPDPDDPDVFVVRLEHIDTGLGEFNGNERYDFIQNKVVIRPTGFQRIDQVSVSSAVLAANLIQMRETFAAYRSGDISVTGDTAFLLTMTEHSVRELPGILGQARGLSGQVSSLVRNPRVPGSSLRDLPGIISALRGAGSNLRTVAASTNEVDDLAASAADASAALACHLQGICPQ